MINIAEAVRTLIRKEILNYKRYRDGGSKRSTS